MPDQLSTEYIVWIQNYLIKNISLRKYVLKINIIPRNCFELLLNISRSEAIPRERNT